MNWEKALLNRASNVVAYKEDINLDIGDLVNTSVNEWIWLIRTTGTCLVPLDLIDQAEHLFDCYLSEPYMTDHKVKVYYIEKNKNTIKKVTKSFVTQALLDKKWKLQCQEWRDLGLIKSS
jgi:hypothetical protein